MVAGCSARGAEGAERDGDVQSPGSKVQSHVAGEVEFEDWRLKTSFCAEGHPEGWPPNAEKRMQEGDSITRTRTTTRTKTEGDSVDIDRVRLRSYQRAVFEDHTSGIVVLHWSRQIGKSFVLAAWAVIRLLSRPGRLVTVLSNSRENGAEFLTKCAEICALNGTRFDTVVRSHPKLEFEDMRMELRIRYRGKVGRIKVLAANPRTARGFSGDLILDEFAFHENGNAVWAAAEPILASNRDFLCRIASTGNGRHNMFYRMIGDQGQGPGSKVQSPKLENIEHPTSNAEHPMENGESRTNAEGAEYGISVGENPTWTRTTPVVAGMIVDGVAYVPGQCEWDRVRSWGRERSGFKV